MRLVTPSYLTLPTKVEDPIPSSRTFFVPASPTASPLSTPASIPHGLSVSEADVINPAVFHFPSAIIVSSGSLFPSRPIAEFLCHLTRMLSDPSHHSAIEWAERKIRVHDPRRLQNDILRKFFRHSKYSSFQRQLNYFGFKKVDAKGKMSPCWFVNVDIDGDDLASLLRLRRKPANRTRRSKEIHSSSIETNSSEQHLNDKKPSQELSPSQEKLSHDISNHIESKHMIFQSRSDEPMVFDPQYWQQCDNMMYH